jgi:hypothetical protein
MLTTVSSQVLLPNWYVTIWCSGAPHPKDYIALQLWWKDNGRGKWCTHRKNCQSATLCTTNYIWTALGLNLGFPERPPTTHLSYGMVLFKGVIIYKNNGLIHDSNKFKTIPNSFYCKWIARDFTYICQDTRRLFKFCVLLLPMLACLACP